MLSACNGQTDLSTARFIREGVAQELEIPAFGCMHSILVYIMEADQNLT